MKNPKDPKLLRHQNPLVGLDDVIAKKKMKLNEMKNMNKDTLSEKNLVKISVTFKRFSQKNFLLWTKHWSDKSPFFRLGFVRLGT